MIRSRWNGSVVGLWKDKTELFTNGLNDGSYYWIVNVCTDSGFWGWILGLDILFFIAVHEECSGVCVLKLQFTSTRDDETDDNS